MWIPFWCLEMLIKPLWDTDFTKWNHFNTSWAICTYWFYQKLKSFEKYHFRNIKNIYFACIRVKQEKFMCMSIRARRTRLGKWHQKVSEPLQAYFEGYSAFKTVDIHHLISLTFQNHLLPENTKRKKGSKHRWIELEGKDF